MNYLVAILVALSVVGCGRGFRGISEPVTLGSANTIIPFPGSTGSTTGDGGSTTGSSNPTPPPDLSGIAQQIANANPGLINNCEGRPYANDFLIAVVRALQAVNGRFGFFKKPDGRVPRDILAYAWSNERDGTTKTFVIDFVAAGCNNSQPGDGTFDEPANSARVIWGILNADGIAGNGVWASSP